MGDLRLMWRMLLRDWHAGELTVLGLALLLAVASLSSVGFLTDRVAQALVQESHQLLGGDLLLTADHPWKAEIRQEARHLGLQLTESIMFPSMVRAGDAVHLAEVKAVAPGYPLRGSLRTANATNQADAETRDIPEKGSVWLDERLTAALNINPGKDILLGSSHLKFMRLLTLEPDRGVNLFAFAPRLLLHLDDLPATGLLQPGSRITYRLHLAGEAGQVELFSAWIKPLLGRGERLEDLSNARPEIRTMLERAQKFLNLAALLAVVLAAVAVGFAADRYMRRHLDGCAVMRCLGAREFQMLLIHGGEFLLFGLLAAICGCLLGYAVQLGLQQILDGLLLANLPASSWRPWLHGLLVALVLLVGFALPPLLRLRSVSTLRVLRREWMDDAALTWSAYLAGCCALVGLMFWIAGDWRLGLVVTGGFLLALGAYCLLAHLFLRWLGQVAVGGTASWRIGLLNLWRHSKASLLQSVALGLGLTALLLLTVARHDLLESWQRKVPADAPNRFLINIQPDQRTMLRDYFLQQGLSAPSLEPMVRGRLVQINGQAITSSTYADERAQRLADREFNLSWAAELPYGNSVEAGRWHGVGATPAAEPTEFSVEQGIAETLKLAIDDELVYDIAGEKLKGKITSLRRLDWDSMRVNFFVITPPGVLEKFPATYITSFHLPAGQVNFINALVSQFSNLTVIDVASLLRQMQMSLDQLASAVQLVFGFALLAGLMVLYAALQSSYDERIHELALLRTFGAIRRQLMAIVLTEFAVLGAIGGLLAGLGTAGISWALAHFVFHLDYVPRPSLLVWGVAIGSVGVALTGWLGTAGAMQRPALEALRGD